MAGKSLAQVQSDAQALFDQINKAGINVTDRPSIVTAAKSLLAVLNDLTPHINDAHSAFANQDANKKALTDLINKLNKVIAVYSG